ncbi:hypothetical protein [Trichocoleus sp. DQ-U1]|uniref:hypothetical protein n=1 Tax=Trichocoleus sp. DQ-U1 TaxID=2933926 RepID=UPI003298385D
MTVRSNQPPVENFPAVMSRLYSQSEDVRIAALPEILQYGQLGKDLLIKIIETEKGALLESAFELFVDVSSKKYEQLTIELNKSNESLNDVTKKIDKEISQLKSHVSQLDKEINQLKFQINQLEKEIENLENNKNRLTQKSNELSQYRFHEEAK